MVTFLEDAIRIVTQWSDQLLYLHDYRRSKQSSLHAFILVIPLMMIIIWRGNYELS